MTTPTPEQLRELKDKLAEHERAQKEQHEYDPEGYDDAYVFAITTEAELHKMAVDALPALIAAAEERNRLIELLEDIDKADGTHDIFMDHYPLKLAVRVWLGKEEALGGRGE